MWEVITEEKGVSTMEKVGPESEGAQEKSPGEGEVEHLG